MAFKKPRLHWDLRDHLWIIWRKYFCVYTRTRICQYDKSNENSSWKKKSKTQNEFYLTEPDGLEILSVKNIYLNKAYTSFLGHPLIGALSFGELKDGR